jgi:hypothetical protein
MTPDEAYLERTGTRNHHFTFSNPELAPRTCKIAGGEEVFPDGVVERLHSVEVLLLPVSPPSTGSNP